MQEIVEKGEVIEIKGDTAFVKFRRSAACGKCRACGMLSNQNEIVVEMPNSLNAKAGDHVSVQIRMNKAMKASVIAYVFPLLMLFLGIFAGWLLSDVLGLFVNADITMALCAIIFVILSFLLLKIAYPLYNKTVSNVYAMISRNSGAKPTQQ